MGLSLLCMLKTVSRYAEFDGDRVHDSNLTILDALGNRISESRTLSNSSGSGLQSFIHGQWLFFGMQLDGRLRLLVDSRYLDLF